MHLLPVMSNDCSEYVVLQASRQSLRNNAVQTFLLVIAYNESGLLDRDISNLKG